MATTGNLISAKDFCVNHNIEISFIQSLQETGLIEITTIEDTGYIYANRLAELERMVRLHYELDINIEGIETIGHLLQRINDMNDQITSLRNRLVFYETDES
jgi:hypothetical protein